MTFAIVAEEDDLDKVTGLVDGIFTVLQRGGASNVSGPMDKEEFKRRVLGWAEKLGVKVRSLAVRPMKSKVGMMFTAGNFTFNAELLAFERQWRIT